MNVNIFTELCNYPPNFILEHVHYPKTKTKTKKPCAICRQSPSPNPTTNHFVSTDFFYI